MDSIDKPIGCVDTKPCKQSCPKYSGHSASYPMSAWEYSGICLCMRVIRIRAALNVYKVSLYNVKKTLQSRRAYTCTFSAAEIIHVHVQVLATLRFTHGSAVRVAAVGGRWSTRGLIPQKTSETIKQLTRPQKKRAQGSIKRWVSATLEDSMGNWQASQDAKEESETVVHG